MRICYLDAFSGISGDMTVAALIDAGADWNALRSTLEGLNLGASFRVEKTTRKGIAASRFVVENTGSAKHRHLPQIEKIISTAGLNENVQTKALAVFRRLGEAEAKAHNLPIEKIHFHEVGAADSICDIVGACAALDLLGVDEICSSPINVGSGTVETSHGILPVPAPATAHLLRDRPIYSAGPEAELTTPTGAALVSALASDFGGVPALRIQAQGFGAGTRDFPSRANVLRVLIGERSDAPEAAVVTVLEANIDDCSPQVLGYAMERLLASGALDVTLTPMFMKKNRPATLVAVLAAPERAEELIGILFAETTTLGVRVSRAERRVLSRKIVEIETLYGKVRIKYAENGAFAPEYEDCRRAATEKNVPLRTVIAEANDAFRRQVTSRPNHE